MKTGLVLEGGGAKGAFHCGAIKALYDNGYVFDGVAGTSIGAINAALVVQDKGYSSMIDMWTHVMPSEFTDLDDIEVEKLFNKELNKDTVKYWAKQVIKVVRNLGIPTDKVLEFLSKHISEERVRASDMDFGIVTYSLSDREPLEIFIEDIPIGSLHNYLLASAYYPAFRLEKLDGKFFIDGGVYDNMPIAFLAQKGYGKIIAVRTMSKMPYIIPERTDLDIDYICPSEDLGGTMQVSAKMINRNIKLGYYDALRYLRGYAGKRYYIDGNIEEVEKAVFSAATKLDKASVYKELKSLFPTEKEEESLIEFLEYYADLCGLDKFRIYKPTEFVQKIRMKAADVEINDNKLYHIVMKERIKKDKLFISLMKVNKND